MSYIRKKNGAIGRNQYHRKPNWIRASNKRSWTVKDQVNLDARRIESQNSDSNVECVTLDRASVIKELEERIARMTASGQSTKYLERRLDVLSQSPSAA